MESARPNIVDTDISPEAIKDYLAPHASLFVRYIQLRAASGLDKLFELEGRLVLVSKKSDSEETKKLIAELINISSNDIIQRDIADLIAKWNPILTPDAANAIIVRVHRRYFAALADCAEWKKYYAEETQRILTEPNGSKSLKGVIDQLKGTFCYWMVLPYLATLGADEESKKIVKKVDLLRKLLHKADDFQDLLASETTALHTKLTHEFTNIKAMLTEGKIKKHKHIKQENLHTLLEQNVQKILLEYWLPSDEKINVAVACIDQHISDIANDKKFNMKDKKIILTEVLEPLKKLMGLSKIKSPENNSTPPLHNGLFAEASTKRISHLRVPQQNASQIALIEEFKVRQPGIGKKQ